jgi:hypothetical protein
MLKATDVIEKVKRLNLPLGKYSVIGGASLAVRGIRETRDLDILVIPELFDELHRQGWPLDKAYESRWSRKRLKVKDVEIYPDFLLEKQNVFIDVLKLIDESDLIDGIAFQPLNHLKVCKLDCERKKDAEDVMLIESYLAKHA